MRKIYATCPECEHQYRVKFLKWFFAPNMYSLWIHVLQPSGCMFYWRWLQCPACKNHHWTPLEDELFVEGRRSMNECLQNMNDSFKALTDYLSEHHDEIVEELKHKTKQHLEE